MLIDRPPLTEGWHLLVMLIVGVIVVSLIHRLVKRRVAQENRKRTRREGAQPGD